MIKTLKNQIKLKKKMEKVGANPSQFGVVLATPILLARGGSATPKLARGC